MNILNWFRKTATETNTVDTAKKIETYVGNMNNTKGVLEPYSPTWIYIKNYLEEQIEKLRQKNDNPTLSYEKTQVIRGQIKELKLILALPENK